MIHRGNVAKSRALMSPYLPATPGASTGSPYSEGGALYALGLIHANHGHDARQLLLDSLRATQQEVGVCATESGVPETRPNFACCRLSSTRGLPGAWLCNSYFCLWLSID